jgi:PAS domain S-box-containing protein
MARLPLSGLRLQLLALVLIALIPTTVLGFYVGLVERRDAAADARQHTLDLVRLIAAREGEQITGIRQILPLLAMRSVVRDRSDECPALLRSLRGRSPYYANVGAADLRGDVYCSALPLQGRVNIADRAYFKNAVRTRGFSVGEYQIGRISGKAAQNFGYPIFTSAGAVQGVVFVALDLSWFVQIAAGTPLPEDSALLVIDRNNTVLSRFPDPVRWVGNTMPDEPLTRAVRAGAREGTVESRSGLDGIQRMYAFAPLGQGADRGAAYVALGIPAAVAFAEADRTLAGALAVLGVVAMLAFAAASALGDRVVVRGINRLLAATTRLRAGDLTARAGPPYPKSELGAVAHAFDDMVRSLQARLAETAKAQDALRHSERRFRALIENSSDATFLTDATQSIVYASPAIERILGYGPDELVGRKIGDFQHPDDTPQTGEVYARLAAERGARTSVTFRVRHRGGSWRWLDGMATNLLEDPSVRAIVGNFRDITARRRAEEALRRNERRFRALIEHSSDVTVLAHADGTITYASPPIGRVLGYPPEEIVGQSIYSLVHPDDVAAVTDAFANIVREPGARASVQARARRKDGSWRWMDAMGVNLLADPDVEAIVGHLWDVTTRKEAEEAVRRRAADLEALHAIAHDLRQARSLAEMYDTLVDRTMAMFGALHGSLALLNPDRTAFTRVCTKGIADEIVGSTFPVSDSHSGDVATRNISYVTGDFATEVRSHSWMDPEPYRILGPFALVPVRSEESILGTLVVARARGPASLPFTEEDVRVLETIAETAGSAIRRAQLYANLQGHAAELETRVAERTTALRAAKDEADRASRAKSEFLSRMSHELRTPLNAVLGFAQLLEMDSLSTEQRENVDYIMKGGRHLLTLINEVLDISRIEAGRLDVSLESVPLQYVIRETLDLMRPIAAETHAVLAGDPDRVRDRYVLADGGRLRQILLNFVSNALKYGGRDVTVTLSCVETAPGRLRLTVADTGPGIPADKVQRLFVPFERLGVADTGIEGTGLGLALSKGLAQAMGGTVGVETAVGRGSVFWVELPAAESPLKLLAAAGRVQPGGAPPDGTPGRTVTVLYIEDNLSNYDLVKRVLNQYPQARLLPAMQGRLGLDLARRHRPDVILLDLHLPDIAGDEVLARLREAPETRAIPVIMISADATHGQAQRLTEAGALAYLTKPLDLKQFLTILDELFTVPEVRHGSGQ